jgi:Ca2+-binding RTX toxin-like protein
VGLRATSILAPALVGALLLAASQAGAAPRVGTTCFGQAATIVGTDGDDALKGTPGNDVIVAGDGSDVIFADAGDDLICGEGGGDFIFAEDGNDQIDAGTGNDAIDAGPGDDKISGGPGGENDLLLFLDATGPVTASLATGTATGGEGNDTITNIGSLIGGPFNDTLTGDASTFNGLGGGPGDDVLDGGDGFDGDILSQGPETVNLATGAATGADGNDTLRNMEGIEGTAQDDNFTGNDDTNVIDGRGGNDILNGLGGSDLIQGDAQFDQNPGNDVISGGEGDDFLQPSPGNDTLDGGPGRLDMIDFSPMLAVVSANLATGKLVGRGIGNMKVSNVEGLFGSSFNDTLIGDKGPNFLLGNGGTDKLLGAAGDDFLSGGDGGDSFDGGPGTDYCLDGRGPGCEFSGTPSGSARIISAHAADIETLTATADGAEAMLAPGTSPHIALPATASAAGDNSELGLASCVGSTSRKVAGLRAEKRRTSAGPPHRAPSGKSTQKGLAPDLVPDWLAGPLDLLRNEAEQQLTWQGTLYRYDAKKKAWRSYKKTAKAFGQVDPSGTAIWTTASGAPVGQVTFAVPAGNFAWRAVVQVPGAAALNDWIEPHTDFARAGGGIYAPQCSFAA